jgi:hypothetical protein
MDPFALGEPTDIARRNLRQGDEGRTVVAEVGQADRVPRRLVRGLLAVERFANVFHGGADHGLDHVAGLRRTCGHRRGFHRRNRDADTHRIDVLVLRVALERVDQDETARIRQPLDAEHRIDALEGRQHHRVFEVEHMLLLRRAVFVVLGNVHLPGLDLGGLGIADPFDVPFAHHRFHQTLGIAHATKAEVSDIGLGGNEGHRYLVADLAPAQVGIHDHGELVGRSVAGGHLHRADHDVAGILDELLPGLLGLDRMVDVADRVGMPIRSQTFDFLEGQFGTGGDHQVVIVHAATVVEFDLVLVRMDALGADRDEIDLLLRQQRRDIHFDVAAFAPIDRNPGIRGREVVLGIVRNHRQLVAGTEFFTHFIGGRHTTYAGAENYDMCHGRSS